MSLPREALELSLQFADSAHRAQLPRHRVARWLRAALEAPAQITVRVVGADEGRALNRDYRGKDYATNVLTFDYQREPKLVADLVLCAPVIEQEARDEGKSLAAHYAHLLVHGALHAQGYDHQRRRAAARMEARESELLLALGLPDPYAR
jgi:probable rRNA maturation factor